MYNIYEKPTIEILVEDSITEIFIKLNLLIICQKTLFMTYTN